MTAEQTKVDFKPVTAWVDPKTAERLRVMAARLDVSRLKLAGELLQAGMDHYEDKKEND